MAYRAELTKHGVQVSVPGKGKYFDNAVVETFFKSLKYQMVWRTVFQTRAEAKQALGRYFDGFYNFVRRHSTLDYVSPVQFERLAGWTAKRCPLNRSKSSIAVAMNVSRVINWLEGQPRAKMRVTRFAALVAT